MSSMGRFLDEAQAATRTLPADKAAAPLRLVDTFAIPANPAPATADAPPAWQLLVTMGVIQRCAIKTKALAWLEYFAWERGVVPHREARACKLLTALDGLAQFLNLSSHSTPDDQRAANAITALADHAYLDHSATRYLPAGPEREAQLAQELQEGRLVTLIIALEAQRVLLDMERVRLLIMVLNTPLRALKQHMVRLKIR